ncbi:hypothetical protein J416_03291 [Gracilibacillus halophilus YIM-C55.5]|uniref:Uncharacterized protein n=1 Tax=Gracilibacillus halophilus YIM-C55.5 TaxID=1308866 RepID=N4WF07_9BACI|nr:hypothetical protein [Gracilibacillus halophilus]ENH97854.1 hypothetical protein J416_03291 [Gracilibacillus halophilus YIM-C55.5]
MKYKWRKYRMLVKIGIGVIIVSLMIFFIFQFFSSERKARNVVEQFYQYEQSGDFAQSWDLFHSYMQDKFDKSTYVQDRAHVFLDHFGVPTFEVSMGDTKK